MTNVIRDKIIEATIACINEFGIEKTTIRKIADKAGVNSSAISYYFKGKESLINIALEVTLANAFDWSEFSSLSDLPAVEKIKQICLYLMEGGLRYKGIARAHYYETFMNENYDTPAVRKLNEFLDTLYNDVKGDFPHLTNNQLKAALTQIAYSTLVSASFMPGFFSSFNGVDLSNEKYRKSYVSALVDGLLLNK